MQTRINYRKAIIWGSVVLVINIIVGNLLWLNPVVRNISQKYYEGHPSVKSLEYFGGLGKYLSLTMLFGVFFVALLIILYLLLYRSLPGQGWKKGIFFGLMASCIKALPEAFNQYMTFIYPTTMILVQLANTVLGLILFGIYMSIIFKKTKVIETFSRRKIVNSTTGGLANENT